MTTAIAGREEPRLARPQAVAIEIEGLVVRYGDTRAVDGLSLVVPCGSVFGFLGPNGAGKTTTIKALLGFRSPDAGRARVLGYDVVTQSLEVRARVGYVSEVNSLYDYLTIPQICAFSRSTSRRWNQQIVDHYLSAFGLPSGAKVGQLSRGMKSQLALSLALGHDPDLLILDEPTSGLDPVARRQFLNMLVGDIAAAGKTVFFSTHILADVEAVADRVGIIRQGRLVVSDELDHLKQTHKVLKLTYAEVPPVSEVDTLRALPGVVSVQQEGRSVRILARGDIEAIAHTVQSRPYAPRDVSSIYLNLEDIFLEHMQEESSDGG